LLVFNYFFIKIIYILAKNETMGYLIQNDYNRLIQDPILSQIISGNLFLLPLAEASAQAEIISYLVQKYNTEKEFTNTQVYNNLSIYHANDRVYLNPMPYNNSSPYNIGDFVLQNAQVYIAIATISIPESFNIAHWDLVGNQYDLYYAPLPFSEFQVTNYYNIGDHVFWNDIIYLALKSTAQLTHDNLINYYDSNNVPYPNPFPDDPINGPAYWLSLGGYSIPAGSLLNPFLFTFGDNRNPQMVEVMIDNSIYKLYKRLSPKPIPEDRANEYKKNLLWLVNVAKGKDITANIEEYQPMKGSNFRYGTKIKQINSY
jgi:hypothetical protein